MQERLPERDYLCWHKLAVVGIWFALAVAALILWRFNPQESQFYPTCLFSQWTGLSCGGCGMLRSTHALTQGQILEAWHYNPLWVAALPLILGVLFWHTVEVFRGRPWRVVDFFLNHIIYSFIAGLIIVAFTIFRNL